MICFKPRLFQITFSQKTFSSLDAIPWVRCASGNVFIIIIELKLFVITAHLPPATVPLCHLQLNQNLCREYHVRGFRIQSTDIGDTPPRLRTI